MTGGARLYPAARRPRLSYYRAPPVVRGGLAREPAEALGPATSRGGPQPSAPPEPPL